MTTALAGHKLLREVRLSLLKPHSRFGFNEFSRHAGDFPMSAAHVTYWLDGGKMSTARPGLVGIEPAPRRIAQVETMLDCQTPGDAIFRAAAVDAMEDHQTSADYRRDLVHAVVRRALE